MSYYLKWRDGTRRFVPRTSTSVAVPVDPKAGHEFSVAGGFTYSLPNTDLQYQNGIDFHVDWAASQFLSKNFQIGVVGYFYQQITDDTGPGAKLGGFRGQAIGIGPQLGFIIPLSEGYQGT